MAKKRTPKISSKREAFLRQSERAVKISFVDGITRFKRRLSLDKLGEMYQSRDYKGIDKHIGWDDIDAHLVQAKEHVGRAYDKAVGNAIDSVATDEVNPAYIADVSSKATQQKLKLRQRKYLKDLPDNRKAIHALVAEGHKLNRAPADVARDIKGQIGLNRVQTIAIKNFRAKLESQGLPPSVVQRRVEAKERRSLNYRADTIAITETRVAAAAAEETAWQQQVKDGILPRDIEKIWLCEPDACQNICKPMAGVQVPLDELWTLPSGDKSSPGSAHPRCRCESALVDPAS